MSGETWGDLGVVWTCSSAEEGMVVVCLKCVLGVDYRLATFSSAPRALGLQQALFSFFKLTSRGSAAFRDGIGVIDRRGSLDFDELRGGIAEVGIVAVCDEKYPSRERFKFFAFGEIDKSGGGGGA